MVNKLLIKFIKEARKRGYDDYEIRAPLIKEGWNLDEIEKAFYYLKPKYKYKNRICIFLDSELLEKIEKRAKKNMFTINEQIEDVLRRSCLSLKKTSKIPKTDDLLVSIFSRERRGKKKGKSH